MKRYLAAMLTLGALLSASAAPALAQSQYTTGARDNQTINTMGPHYYHGPQRYRGR